MLEKGRRKKSLPLLGLALIKYEEKEEKKKIDQYSIHPSEAGLSCRGLLGLPSFLACLKERKRRGEKNVCLSQIYPELKKEKKKEIDDIEKRKRVRRSCSNSLDHLLLSYALKILERTLLEEKTDSFSTLPIDIFLPHLESARERKD